MGNSRCVEVSGLRGGAIVSVVNGLYGRGGRGDKASSEECFGVHSDFGLEIVFKSEIFRAFINHLGSICNGRF